MQARIGKALENCQGCTADDMLIVAALAQNGEFSTPESRVVLYQASGDANGGGIDWKTFINSNYPDFPFELRVRTAPNFDNFRYLLIAKYMQDMLELYRRGWALPEGISEGDLKHWIEWAQNNGNSTSQ